jgi:hypothetical protein
VAQFLVVRQQVSASFLQSFFRGGDFGSSDFAVWMVQVSGADLEFRAFGLSRLTPFVSCRREETEPD